MRFLIWTLWRGLNVLDGFLAFLVVLGPHNVNCSGVERGLDVRRVVFLDHLDTRAAILCDLVDVGALHQAQADVCMTDAVRRTRSAFAIEAKIFPIEDWSLRVRAATSER